MAGNFLRQTQRQSCWRVIAFDSIPETSGCLAETCTWAIWRGPMQFGPDLNGTILFLALPVQLSLWPGCFLFSLACYLPICKVWSTVTQSKDQWNLVHWKQVQVTTSSAASQILYPTYYLALWPVLNSCYSALYPSSYSALYTSWLCKFMQPQPHTLYIKFH